MQEWADDHKTLVVLGVENEAELKGWKDQLGQRGIACEVFVEPDIGDQATALAVHPTADHSLFRDLRLL